MATTPITKFGITPSSHTFYRNVLYIPTHCRNTLGIAITRRNPAQLISLNRQLHHSVKRPQISPPPAASKVLMSASIFSFFGSLFSSTANSEEKMDYPDKRTEDQWRTILTPEQFRVIRQKGTEAPYTGTYDKHYPSGGVYNCAACDAPLYKSDTKFKSGCGWPAYFDALPGAVTRHVDNTFGMERTEIVCSNCGGHLGHVFKGEGYPTPTDERHCVNSISLKFNEGGDDKKQEAASKV